MSRWFDVMTTPPGAAPTRGETAGGAPRVAGRRRWRRTAVVAALTAVAMGGGVAVAAGPSGTFGDEQVGTSDARGILLPNNQRLLPYGTRIEMDNGRLLSSAVSPDGTRLAALSWKDFTGFLSIFDLTTGRLIQQVGTGGVADPTIGDGTVAADGPLYSADGRTLWFPQSADLLRFSVRANGTVNSTPISIPMVDSTVGAYLPSGMALSPQGNLLYVALNAANTLGVVNTATNRLIGQIPVGIAPRQVALAGNKVFVSNEGGRPVTAADKSTNLTNSQLTPGTPVVSDPSTGAVNNGTVSVVDTGRRAETATIKVGLEPTALTLSGNTLLVANSNDDSMSVIDVARQQVTATVNVNPLPGSTVGSYPNAIAMPDPDHIIVSIGRDNALAVYRFNGNTGPVQYEGLIPTDFYPVNVVYDAPLGKYVVTNDRGIGSRGGVSTITEGPDTNPATGHNTYDDTGTLTTFAPPSEAQLGRLTHQVFLNNDWQKLLAGSTLAQPSSSTPVAIPAKLGDPSTIKHVFLIVKENRTYDQVLGDLGKGNGDPTLTQFGGSVTPNQHALSNTYTTFDNFYDEGTLSADGHNWLVQADANDYIEKEFGAFYRSYPAQGGDALAYQRDGFLWNAAEAAGKTVQNFGEYNNYFNVSSADDDWSKWYQDSLILEGKAPGPLPIPINKYKTYSDIPSLNDITDPAYPRFDTNVPDQYRTDIWLRAFQNSEQTGNLADLTMLWVPDDHTAGTSGASPYPTAAVADNDLAVGRMIDTISHSQFWSSSAVFVLEDDPQAGADHVDGHRSTLYVASPYAKQNVVDSTYYSQLNVVKTIEQILGIAPMNQEDRAAEPMYDAFNQTQADVTPFAVRPNQIPLTYGLDTGADTGGSAGSSNAATADVPAAEQANAAAWATWSRHQQFGGSTAAEDSSNPAQLNRLDWYASTGWTRPYPGDTRILGPYEVPGWNRPAQELG